MRPEFYVENTRDFEATPVPPAYNLWLHILLMLGGLQMELNNQSEVAWQRQQIEAETISAMRGLYSFAEYASHDAINSRMENMYVMYATLKDAVGEGKAIEALAEAMNRQQ
jgi:NADH:ubiquinone oxidoreductase subunit